MLIGVIGPPRSERMTGPELKFPSSTSSKHWRDRRWRGIVRPLFFFAAQSRSSIDRRNLAARVEHHIPGEFGDFAGTQASLHREENDDPIAKRVSGRTGVGKELGQLPVIENFCLLACHLTLDAESLNLRQLVVNERMRYKSEKVLRRSATQLMKKGELFH